MTPTNIKEMIKAVNQLLQDGEPANISVDDYSGYTGYKPQYIIDAMNEVFDFGSWGFEEISNEIAEGEKATLIVSQVRVFLKGIDFQPTGWGQSRITKGDIGDARKGAQTDAIKKALSYFSIGNRAYQGLLKKDAPAAQNGKASKAPRMLPQALESIPTVSQLKEQCSALFGADKWEIVKEKLNLIMSDEEMSPEHCAIVARQFARKAS